MQDEDRNVGFVSQAIDCGAGSTGFACLHHSYTDVKGCTYLPVSPLVAPTTVNLSRCSPSDFFLFLRSRKNSKRFPSNCKATSLKAKVGPWKSSKTYTLSFSFFNGATSGCRNVEYDFATRFRNSAVEISSGEIYSERIATDSSTKEYELHSDFQFGGRDGMWSGMYSPPFGARPVRTVCWSQVHLKGTCKEFKGIDLFEGELLIVPASGEVLHCKSSQDLGGFKNPSIDDSSIKSLIKCQRIVIE